MGDTQQAVVATATVRARGYAEDQDSLLAALKDIGPARVRPLHLPEAGGVAEVWFVIQFVGYSLIGGAVYDIIKYAANRLLRWARERPTEYGLPEVVSVKLDLDDVVVELRSSDDDESAFMTEPEFALAVEALDRLPQIFPPEVLERHDIQYIQIRAGGDDPTGKNPQAVRYFVGVLAPFVTHEFDPAAKLLIDGEVE